MDKIFSFVSKVFTSGDVVMWGKVLYEVFDFMVKGAIAYAGTEQGAKEWDDVVSRFEEATNSQANGGSVSFSVESVKDAKSQKVGERLIAVEE